MRQTKVVNEVAFQYYHRLQEIKRFIEEHYMEEISLKKAARIAGLEKKYFSSFFHRKVGVGFKHWLTHLRVARAMDLMKAEDYTISEVAYSAGFKTSGVLNERLRNTPSGRHEILKMASGLRRLRIIAVRI
ncbi:MAG TPA: AraC family transcriptional regulator [Candidatus Binatia bacterium]